jgi:hypothetical protein
MKEEFSDEFMEQCRISIYGGRDITLNWYKLFIEPDVFFWWGGT